MNAPAVAWAEWHFGEVECGDRRLTRRIVRLARAFTGRCQQTARGLETHAERKGMYRALNNPKVTREAVMEPHLARTRAQCRNTSHVVLIEDKSQLDFTSHPATEGLGRIGDDRGQGFIVQTTLAVEVRSWADAAPLARPIGLFEQQVWTRTGPPRKGRESARQRRERSRESEAWARNLAREEDPGPDRTWTYVADREADIYEMYDGRVPPWMELVIRASWKRRLDAREGNLWEAVESAPLLGTYGVDLRSRAGQAGRRAEMALRATCVRLRPPHGAGNRSNPAEVWVVEAREAAPPEGAKGLHWILTTNRPVRSLEAARRVVSIYSLRWIVEEYHKALKTGTGIEDSQLRTAKGLLTLLGILSVVAVWLLDAKTWARVSPEEPVREDLCPPAMGRILAKCKDAPPPGQVWTVRCFVRALAQLGGFMGRAGDGEPGWQVIWCGWIKAADRLAGYLLAQEEIGYG